MTPEEIIHSYRRARGPAPRAANRVAARLDTLGPPPNVATPPAAASSTAVTSLAALGATSAAVVVALVAGAPDEQAPRPGTPAPANVPTATTKAHVATLPVAPAQAREEQGVPRPAPAPRPRRRSRTQASPRTKARPATIAPPADSLRAEIQALGRARAALLRGDVDDATRLLQRYEAQFTAPKLAEEADALRAMITCATRGPDQEHSRAFDRAHPRSMFQVQVARSCTPKPTTTGKHPITNRGQ